MAQLPPLPSLNSKAALDARAKQDWPREASHFGKIAVLGCRFVPVSESQKTPKFAVRTKVLETDNPSLLGRVYTIYIPAIITPMYQHLADATRAQFFAACLGENSDDREYDCDKAQQTVVDMDEAGDLESGECVIMHKAVSKTKAGFDPKTGAPITKTNCNHTFSKA